MCGVRGGKLSAVWPGLPCKEKVVEWCQALVSTFRPWATSSSALGVTAGQGEAMVLSDITNAPRSEKLDTAGIPRFSGGLKLPMEALQALDSRSLTFLVVL